MPWRFPHPHFFFCSHLDQWFLVVSTQLIGFSAGGIARRFLVTPPSMIWPTTLVTCALFNTLHSQQYAGSGRLGGMTRERFFLYAFAASYLWCECIILSVYSFDTESVMLRLFPWVFVYVIGLDSSGVVRNKS